MAANIDRMGLKIKHTASTSNKHQNCVYICATSITISGTT